MNSHFKVLILTAGGMHLDQTFINSGSLFENGYSSSLLFDRASKEIFL